MISRSRILTVLGAVSASQLLVVSSVYAQQTTGILTGRVTDAKSGKPLADVAVVVTSNSLQGEQSVVTDSSGYYRIPSLPAGVYNIQMFRGSYKPGERTGVRLAGGQSIKINQPLSPEGADAIDVVIEAPQIDTGTSQTGVNMGQDFLKRVPVVPPTGGGGAVRSFEAVATAAPGAASDTYGTSLGGATSPENTFLVNGVNTANTALGTNGSPLSIEFMEEVQVITGAYMPEFGLNTGGTISASVKRGSNTIAGHTWATYSPGALFGTPKVIRRNSSSIRSWSELNWVGDIGADIGGPIIKDKIWFYTGVMLGQTNVNLNREISAFETEMIEVPCLDNPDENCDQAAYVVNEKTGQYEVSPIKGSKRTYQARGSTIQAMLNLTFAVSKNSKVDLTASALPTFAGGDGRFAAAANNGTAGSALNGSPDTLITKTVNVPVDVSLRWTADADNKRWNFEQGIAWHHESARRLASDGNGLGGGGRGSMPLVQWRQRRPVFHALEDFEDLGRFEDSCGLIDSDPRLNRPGLPVCPVDTYFTGGPGGLPSTKMDSIQVRQATTRIAQLAGHHEIKFGANYALNRFDNEKGLSGGIYYRELASGGGIMQMLRGYGYLRGPDDPVYLDKLEFTTKMHVLRGFAQDSWAIMDKITLNAGLLYDMQTVIGGLGDVTMGLYKQFSPRIGFVWDPTQKGRAKIRANFGRYYQSMTLQLADRAGTPEPGIGKLMQTGDGTECGDLRELETRCDDFNSILPGTGGDPSTRFYRIGSSKTPIDPAIRAPGKDELALGADWEFMPGYAVGVDATWSRLFEVIEDMSRDNGATYFIGNPGRGIASDFPTANREYQAYTLRLEKKWSKHWMINGNYTLAFLKGNYNGLFKETGQLDPNITSDFDLVSLLPNRTGYLDGDVRHRVKIFAAGDIPVGEKWMIDLGGSFNGSSGRATNFLGSHELYGLNESFLLPRGSGERMPWVYNVNVRGGIGFAFSKSSRVSFAIDAFNVLNFQQVTARDNLYTQDSELLPVIGGKTEGDLEKAVELLEEKRFVDAKIAELGGVEPTDEQLEEFQNEAEESVTREDAVAKLKEKNFHQPTQYQQPRQVTFSLRFNF
jgi:hypothetical protein